MSAQELRTHLAEVVCNEILPGLPGELVVHRMALWVPTVQKRFEFSVYSVLLEEEPCPWSRNFRSAARCCSLKMGSA